ncbi:hypothetical protein DXX93_10975 [Thalassotalea euphylliae]|uniref:2OG-Fe(II) oxygenase n=1 Tax=Thalassotalea euphylliae TaxID=1655234 RepID=A0A3E0TQV9_9GAMM|nr:DUF6445 family protein [Thalassotalea euphylliae]REL27031.1 hypothetical protein DXX93_10975 [Thalassotalea euphylliae]
MPAIEAATEFIINPNFTVRVKRIGLEETPVLVIDDYLANIDELRQQASKQDYCEDKQSFYPGIRSPIATKTVTALIQPVLPGFYKVLKVPNHLKPAAHPSYFSLITKQPEQLVAMQTIPHFDTSRPYYFAALLYLNEFTHGGTGFFRHKATHYERITDSKVDSYLASVQAEFDGQNGQDSHHQGYQTGSNQQYALIDSIPYQTNCLVIYPGNLLHSTLVDNNHDINEHPITGRLTANIFVEFQ